MVDLPQIQVPTGYDIFDWFILLLRIAFIALIYLFLYQVGRLSVRELVAVGTSTSAGGKAPVTSVTPLLTMVDPAESDWSVGSTFALDPFRPMHIGRNMDNTIVINDSFVSGQHAEIEFADGTWWLTDLGSTNGTFVNGRRISRTQQLSSGDEINFGKARVRAQM